METKLIIFDFDGTLGDTRQTIVTTMQMTIAALSSSASAGEELKLPKRSDEECAATIGLPLASCFKALFPHLSDDGIQRCAETYRRIFDDNVKSIQPQAFPGVVETLAELKKQGFTLTIASSRSHKSLDELVHDLHIAEFISLLIGADDVAAAKPDPEPVLTTLHATGFDASQALVVGDMNVDILMGVNAGARTCGVIYGNGTKKELLEAGADYIIDSIDKLLDKAGRKKDPMGRAIADYHRTMLSAHLPEKTSKLRVFSPMFDEDEIPLPTLFRSYKSMPEIERRALDAARGKVLDVGAGAGCHALVLQERGIDVTAIDISPLSVATMKERGVRKVFEQDFFTMEGQQYDTILMLMNGIGIVGTMRRMPAFFRQLDKILAPGGQVLCDSSDISYVFETEDGTIEYPDTNGYYGELCYQMQYKDTIGQSFPWLYIDADTLKQVAAANGYTAEVYAEGDHYDYLARITKK